MTTTKLQAVQKQLVLLLVLVLAVHYQGTWAFNSTVAYKSARLLSADHGPGQNTTTINHILTSLLGSKDPIIRLGTGCSDIVTQFCRQIAAAGNESFRVNMIDSESGCELHVRNVSGYQAGREGFETTALLTEKTGEKIALVCSGTDGSGDCALALSTPRPATYETADKCCYEVRGGEPCCFECPSCFPGDAVVQTASGELKHIVDLELSEKIAVRNSLGNIVYDDVYIFGHKDAMAFSKFLKISMAPVGTQACIGGQATEYKRANEIKLGDVMWALPENTNHVFAADHQSLAPYIVTDISTAMKRGLYNPYTLSGTIIVNGVAASVHSDWFLDGIFDFLGLSHLLPVAYQVLLAPVRILYTVMGRNVYIAVYTWLDLHFNMIHLLSHYPGAVSTTAAVFASLCIMVCFSKNKTV